jgi:hypothetical protein
MDTYFLGTVLQSIKVILRDRVRYLTRSLSLGSVKYPLNRGRSWYETKSKPGQLRYLSPCRRPRTTNGRRVISGNGSNNSRS